MWKSLENGLMTDVLLQTVHIFDVIRVRWGAPEWCCILSIYMRRVPDSWGWTNIIKSFQFSFHIAEKFKERPNHEKVQITLTTCNSNNKSKNPGTTTRRDMTYTPATLDIGQWTNSGRSVDKHDVSEFSIFRLDALCSSSLTPKQRQPFEVQ